MILALDPGYERTAVVGYDCDSGMPLGTKGIESNEAVVAFLRSESESGVSRYDHLAVEMIASYGMPVGREIFETCVWIGRFLEAWGGDWTLIYRREVKLELCGSSRAKDPHVRQALLDRFGPGREKAIGKKASPGPLYGFKADLWAALGVAVTWAEMQKRDKQQPSLLEGLA